MAFRPRAGPRPRPRPPEPQPAPPRREAAPTGPAAAPRGPFRPVAGPRPGPGGGAGGRGRESDEEDVVFVGFRAAGAAGAAAGGGGGAGPALRKGDWVCPACSDHQFARNRKCRRCGHGKPGEGAPKGRAGAGAARGGGAAKGPAPPVAKRAQYYGVRGGRAPGVYETLAVAEALTGAGAGAKFKAFASREAALAYALPPPPRAPSPSSSSVECEDRGADAVPGPGRRPDGAGNGDARAASRGAAGTAGTRAASPAGGGAPFRPQSPGRLGGGARAAGAGDARGRAAGPRPDKEPVPVFTFLNGASRGGSVDPFRPERPSEPPPQQPSPQGRGEPLPTFVQPDEVREPRPSFTFLDPSASTRPAKGTAKAEATAEAKAEPEPAKAAPAGGWRAEVAAAAEQAVDRAYQSLKRTVRGPGSGEPGPSGQRRRREETATAAEGGTGARGGAAWQGTGRRRSRVPRVDMADMATEAAEAPSLGPRERKTDRKRARAALIDELTARRLETQRRKQLEREQQRAATARGPAADTPYGEEPGTVAMDVDEDGEYVDPLQRHLDATAGRKRKADAGRPGPPGPQPKWKAREDRVLRDAMEVDEEALQGRKRKAVLLEISSSSSSEEDSDCVITGGKAEAPAPAPAPAPRPRGRPAPFVAPRPGVLAAGDHAPAAPRAPRADRSDGAEGAGAAEPAATAAAGAAPGAGAPPAAPPRGPAPSCAFCGCGFPNWQALRQHIARGCAGPHRAAVPDAPGTAATAGPARTEKAEQRPTFAPRRRPKAAKAAPPRKRRYDRGELLALNRKERRAAAAAAAAARKKAAAAAAAAAPAAPPQPPADDAPSPSRQPAAAPGQPATAPEPPPEAGGKERLKADAAYQRSQAAEWEARQAVVERQRREAAEAKERRRRERRAREEQEARERKRIDALRVASAREADEADQASSLRPAIRQQLEARVGRSQDLAHVLCQLNVPVEGHPNATKAQTLGAYKKALKLFHPDKNHGKPLRTRLIAQEAFRLVRDAHAAFTAQRQEEPLVL